MKKYPKRFPANDALQETPGTLEFPVATGFDSRPQSIDPQAMLRRIADTMVWRNQRPGEKERRLAEKIPVEFVL